MMRKPKPARKLEAMRSHREILSDIRGHNATQHEQLMVLKYEAEGGGTGPDKRQQLIRQISPHSELFKRLQEAGPKGAFRVRDHRTGQEFIAKTVSGEMRRVPDGLAENVVALYPVEKRQV
jgi:hypothetical protein